MVYVTGIFDQIPEGSVMVNTTSRSTEPWSAKLSPFFLGPISLYKDYISHNVENAWQYSKVYKHHLDPNGEPTEEYFNWACSGWGKIRADRYPMGKGTKPEYSYWDGKKLGYIEARKKIYIPLYIRAVVHTDSYKKLKNLYEQGDIYI